MNRRAVSRIFLIALVLCVGCVLAFDVKENVYDEFSAWMRYNGETSSARLRCMASGG